MHNKKLFDLIGYGAVAVDDILYVDRYPESDTKVQVNNRERQGGGLTGTALVTAARLGVRTAYFGALGNDELSEFTRSEFVNEHIDISKIVNIPEAKPIYSTIVIDEKTCERTIFYSLEGFDPLPIDAIPSEIFAETRFFMIDTYVLKKFPRLTSLANQFNIPLIADVETDQLTEVSQEMDAIQYLMLNRNLASRITEEEDAHLILNKLDSPKRLCTIITEGKQGCWFKTRSAEISHLPAYTVDTVDTTGCGDVFHGAFTAALIHGKAIEEAVKWGSAAAALKAQHLGGRKGIPDLPTLLGFIESRLENQVEVLSP
jgi:sugar/nucleoside kinase (ribokinase family)